DVTPTTTTGPLPLLWHWRPLRLPWYQGATEGSGVARRVISPLTLGILPWPLCLASQAGKMVHKDEYSLWPIITLGHICDEPSSATPFVIMFIERVRRVSPRIAHRRVVAR